MDRLRGNPENLDRFIPNRSAMDFNYAHYMLTQGRKSPRESVDIFGKNYVKLLAQALNVDRERILAFKDNKTEAPVDFFSKVNLSTLSRIQFETSQRPIPSKPQKILDAPDLLDNFYLNLLDWGSRDVLAIALGNSFFCLNLLDGSDSELLTIDDDVAGPVTSLSWAPNGQHIAVGLNSGEVQLWDFFSNKRIRMLSCTHSSRVGSLAWNGDNILTTGGKDGKIVNHDMRSESDVVEIFRGHHGDVCGLKWSNEGSYLASGGRDKFLHIWDKSMVSLCLKMQCLHRIRDHNGSVRALAWSPHKRNLLASGGGNGDHCIKIWNSQSGQCLNSVDTGSEVCALLWNKYERERLSAQGSPDYKLTLWKYPSMMRMAELMGHSSRVLFMAQSPNGCTVASAAGFSDESLRLWDIFPASKSNSSIELFSVSMPTKQVPFAF